MGTLLSLKGSFNFSQAVRDSLWQHIYLTPELEATTQTPVFNRLYSIKQLGPTEIVYPGATHTRASHSFGVYHIALRLIDSLLAKGAGEWVTKEGISSFMSAALFHDLGHFPFTHSLKELPLKDHEDLTADAILAEPLKSLIAKTSSFVFLSQSNKYSSLSVNDSNFSFAILKSNAEVLVNLPQ